MDGSVCFRLKLRIVGLLPSHFSSSGLLLKWVCNCFGKFSSDVVSPACSVATLVTFESLNCIRNLK